jgi:hypothetical protein
MSVYRFWSKGRGTPGLAAIFLMGLQLGCTPASLDPQTSPGSYASPHASEPIWVEGPEALVDQIWGLRMAAIEDQMVADGTPLLEEQLRTSFPQLDQTNTRFQRSIEAAADNVGVLMAQEAAALDAEFRAILVEAVVQEITPHDIAVYNQFFGSPAGVGLIAALSAPPAEGLFFDFQAAPDRLASPHRETLQAFLSTPEGQRLVDAEGRIAAIVAEQRPAAVQAVELGLTDRLATYLCDYLSTSECDQIRSGLAP